MSQMCSKNENIEVYFIYDIPLKTVKNDVQTSNDISKVLVSYTD